MHALVDYILFFFKAITLIIIILGGFAGIMAIAASAKSKQTDKKKLMVRNLNKAYKSTLSCMNQATMTKKSLKQWHKQQDKDDKKQTKTDKIKPRVFVIDFKGDIHASAVGNLSTCIDAILLACKEQNNSQDTVLLRLESPGGVVHGYGLAAAELARIRAADIQLDIAIDKVAASGGYMMATVGNKVIAAPFAIIGSIGVVMQLPNFHRWLEKNNISIEQITAGEYKRTLTMLGKNTDKDRAKVQEELDQTQQLFKAHIQQYRPQIAIDEIATGEHWFATQCIEKNLVDEISTSSDYLLNKQQSHDIYHLHIKEKLKLKDRILKNAANLSRNTTNFLWQAWNKKKTY